MAKNYIQIFTTTLLLLLHQVSFGQAPTISYPVGAAAVTRGYSQSNLTVKIVFNGACTGTNVKIAFPATVTYMAGTVVKTAGTAGLTIAESSIVDLSNPQFSISGAISIGDDITFTVSRKAECGLGASGKDSVFVTFTGGCSVGSEVSGVINTYNLLAPAFSISSNPAITGAVLGNTYTRTHTITNGGNGGTDTLRFFVVYPSGGIVNNSGTNAITANSVSFTPSSTSGDTLFYKIFGATIFGGDNVFTNAETVTISEPIKVLKCNVNTTYGTRWGRNDATICQTTTASSIVSMATGVPNFTAATGARIGYVDKCTPYDYTLVMTNGGSGNPVAAAMYDLKVIQDQFSAGAGAYGIDTSLFILNNIRVGSTTVPSSRVTWTASPILMNIDLNDLFTSDPDGPGGLSDVDGDGFFDDLLGGGTSFTVTTTKTYKCNLACGYDKIHQYNAAFLLYHFMCDKSTYITSTKQNSGLDYLYESAFVGTAYMPANIFGGTPFRLQIREGHYINSSSHDNANTRYRWKIAMPVGLAPTATPNPKYGTTSVTTSTISGVGGVDTLVITSPTPSLDSFGINMVYTCGSGGALTIPYKLQKLDNIVTGCTCQGDLICTTVSSTLFCPAPCPAGPSNYIPQVRRANGSLGWTDYTLATRQTASAISAYDLSKALYLDTLQVIATALQNNAANNLHVEITLNKTTSPAGLNKLTPVGATTTIYRGGSSVGTYTTTTAITSASTATVQAIEFDFTTGITALPTGGLLAGDSIYTVATYVVATNAGLPTNDIQQGGRNIHFNINGLGGRDYCTDPVPEMYLVGTILQNAHNGFVATGCTPVSLGGATNYLARRFNTAGTLYTNEFRPVMYVDSVVATIPTGYELVSSSYDPQTGGSSLSLTPTSVSGNVYKYVNPGTWQPLGLTVTNNYGGYVPFTVVPTCATVNNEVTNFKVYIRDYYYAYAGLPTPSGLAYEISVPSTGAGKSIAISYSTANKPDITLSDQTGTVQGVKVNQSWTLRIANAGLSTAPYNWISVPTGGSINVTQVTDIATSTVIPSVSFPGGKWYKLSTAGVASGAFKDYKIDFTYSDCNLDSIKVYGGWNCASYPSDPTAYVCGKDSIYLKVDPKPSQVQLTVNRQPGGAAGSTTGIAMCATDSTLIVVNSAQAADLVNPYVTILPPTGLTINTPIKVEYPLGSGNYQNATVTTLAGGVIKIDLTSHTGIGANGILGTASANPTLFPAGQDRQAKLKVDFTTDCAFTSGTTFGFSSFGVRPCGDSATGNGVTVSTNPLNITGASSGGGAGVSMSFGAVTSITCGTPVTLNLSTTPTTLPTQAGDTMIYTLPAGLGYAGGFVGGTNCASCTASSSAGPSNTTIVKIKLQTGVPASSSLLYSFDVACKGGTCASVNIGGVFKRDVTGLLCGATPCGTTSTIIASGTSPNITLNKPSLVLSNVSLPDTSVWVAASYPANHVRVKYNNNGTQAYTANTDSVEFFMGSATTPFSVQPLTKSLAIGANDSSDYMIMVPLGTYTAGSLVTARILTTTTSGTAQCLCNPSSFFMAGVPLPLNFLSTNYRVQNCAVSIDWSYNLKGNEKLLGFEIERSSNGMQYSKISSLSTSVANYVDVTPSSGKWYYRIKANSVGKSLYSGTMIATTSQCVGNTITVYPNPTIDQLQIVLQGNSQNNSYELIDAFGRVLVNGGLISNTNNLVDVSAVVRGVYVLKIVTDGGVSTHQVLIVK